MRNCAKNCLKLTLLAVTSPAILDLISWFNVTVKGGEVVFYNLYNFLTIEKQSMPMRDYMNLQ